MSRTKKNKNEVNDLITSAAASGVVTPDTSQLITGNLGGMIIAGAGGIDAEDIYASDVTLVTLLIDASSSIAYAKLEQAVRDGQNALVDALANSKEAGGILLAQWKFNSSQSVIHSYVGVSDATRLDHKSYRGAGSTVLYDAWFDACAANVAYAQQLRDGGTPCRSVVVVITDGDDTASQRTLRDCAKISRDLLASEQFVLAFVGVGDEVDFRAIAKGMGIPDDCVAVQKNATASTLRKVFNMVSQSAIRASQGLINPGSNAGFFQP